MITGIVCVLFGLANIPFFPDPVAYLAFGWCMAMGLVNFILAAMKS